MPTRPLAASGSAAFAGTRPRGSRRRSSAPRIALVSRNRSATMVRGGTPAFRTTLELTNDNPQITVTARIASTGSARWRVARGSMAKPPRSAREEV